MASGRRSEIRRLALKQNGSARTVVHTLFAVANCMTDAASFYPAFSSLASANDPNQTLTYIGLETFNGASVQHLHSVWSGIATTLLPIAMNYNAHPDNNPTTNIAVQILFSTYENLNGGTDSYAALFSA
jgi:hypothetical protein